MALPSPFRIEVPPPARPVPRAAVRVRGAFHCDGAGYVADTWNHAFNRTFNVRSEDLIGPRAHPGWQIQIQGPDTGRHKGPPSRMVLSGRHAGFGPEVSYSAGEDDLTWRARWSEDLRALDIETAMSGGSTYEGIDVRCRVRWPAVRPPVRVPQSIVDLVGARTGAEPRPFSTWDFGREKDYECASAILPEENKDILDLLRASLPEGWVAFHGSTRWLDDEDLEGVEIVAAPGHGWADMLRTARLDPVNHGMGTEGVIRWLAEYDATFGIEVVGTTTDHVDFTFEDSVEDYEQELAHDLARLCPDLLNHMEHAELAESLLEGAVTLWWD